MKKIKTLFVCIHNSARSQMAEAFLKKHGKGKFKVESAGITPGKLNPLAVQAMKNVGIDISENSTDAVMDFFNEGRTYDYVITVCNESAAGQCPVFPGAKERIHWSLKDPSALEGNFEENLKKTEKIREQIEKKVLDFISNIQ